MKCKFKILLTFDYEVYFKENFSTFEEVLFSPTNELLNIGRKLKVPFTFFIDSMFYKCWSSPGFAPNWFAQFEYQVKSMVDMGHDTQFHFHPHWRDSEFVDDQKFISTFHNWDFGRVVENHGLEVAKKDLADAYEAFVYLTGKNALAHRAGGLSTSRNSHDYLQAIIELGCLIDSSVMPNKCLISDTQYYNYENSPAKSYWRITEQQGFNAQSDSEAAIIELPMFSLPKTLLNSTIVLPHKINRIKKKGAYSKKGLPAEIKIDKAIAKGFSLTFDNAYRGFEKEAISLTKLFMDNYKNDKVCFVTVLNHPKAFNRYSFDAILAYIRYFQNHKHVEFCSMESVLDYV